MATEEKNPLSDKAMTVSDVAEGVAFYCILSYGRTFTYGTFTGPVDDDGNVSYNGATIGTETRTRSAYELGLLPGTDGAWNDRHCQRTPF